MKGAKDGLLQARASERYGGVSIDGQDGHDMPTSLIRSSNRLE